jgi:hypothetical protein
MRSIRNHSGGHEICILIAALHKQLTGMRKLVQCPSPDAGLSGRLPLIYALAGRFFWYD